MEVGAPSLKMTPSNKTPKRGSRPRAKADRLGGVHLLTQEDIDGLSYEQIQRLRGY